jgi:Co/Zn/Cd efflux system component
MSGSCCNDPHRGNPAYRRVLWSVLAINACMFLVEIGAGLAAGSASLQADALDFLGDTANYAMLAVKWRNFKVHFSMRDSPRGKSSLRVRG